MKSWSVFKLLIAFLCVQLLSAAVFASQEAPQTFTFDGRTFSDAAATTPLLDNITLRIQILNQAQDCILYEEQQSVSTTATNGYFTIQVGSTVGAAKRSALDSAHMMSDVYSNTLASLSGKLVSNGAACTYNPANAHVRYVRLLMTPSDLVTRTISPNMSLDSVPFASVAERAETLEGLYPANLIQVNTTAPANLTQANVESIFSVTNFTRLTSLLSVPPANYVQTGANGSALLPVVAGNPGAGLTSGQIWYDSTANVLKYYDGAVKTVGTSGAAAGPIVDNTNSASTAIAVTQSGSGYAGTFMGGNVGIGTTSPGYALQVATTANSTNGINVVSSSGPFANFSPSLQAANWNGLVQAGDGGIIYSGGSSHSGGFVIAPWWTATNAGIRMDSSGNVGIGTAAPGAALDVVGLIKTRNLAVQGVTGTNGGNADFTIRTDSGNGYWDFSTIGANGRLTIYDAVNNKTPMSILPNTPNDTLFLNSSGYVGIGTVSPGQKLDVSGNITTYSKTPSANFPNGSVIAYNPTGSNSQGSGLVAQVKEASYGGLVVGYETSAPDKWLLGISNNLADRTAFVFYEDSSVAKARMTIATGGNVGIGTTNPGTTLDVVGTIHASSGIYAPNLTSSYGMSVTSASYWTRALRVNMSTRYQNYAGKISVSSDGGGGTKGMNGLINFRIKQNAAMGSAPDVNIEVDSANLMLHLADVVTVTTTNTVSATVVDLFVRNSQANESVSYAPLGMGGWNDSVDFTPQAAVAALPTGTQNAATAGMALWTAGTTASTVAYAGNVGIGTTSPQFPLDIQHSGNFAFHAQGTSAANQTSFYFENDRGSFGSYGGVLYGGSATGLGNLFGLSRADKLFVFADGAQNLGFATGTLSAQPYIIGTNNAERIRVDSTGKVGIGNSSPQTALDVNGVVRVAKYAAQPFACDVAHDGSIALTSGYRQCACKGGTTSWVFTSDGVTGCTW